MSRVDRLAEILDRWDRAAENGQPLTPEDACHADPTLLPDFLKLLGKLGHIKPILNGEAAAASPEDLIGHIDAGRFTPVSYHDAGGLGLIFLANDTEVKRTVALKLMQTLAFLDPAARQRFLIEAEITSKLEHPGIVPVYGLGQDADGRPYYAMRFIHGSTFGEGIDALYKSRGRQDDATWNVEFRRLLRSFVSVCQTLAYTHVRGVIHRDLKPANIMLGPYGETLIVDWGLAKRYDLPEPDETVDPGYKPVLLTVDPAGQTIYGRAKGSPAFMAPEQARGEWDRVGPHSDIYSLGATLYVLLTGQKPYTGRSSDEVIQAVQSGRLQRPRRHRPDLPRALEAICLKAMSANPAERYATAKELADDVDRWLADEPVTAYREPFVQRARRWMKKHRTMVSTSVATVFVAAVLLTVLGVVLGAKNRELTQANTNLDIANRNLTDAQQARQADFEEADTALRGIMERFFVRRVTGRDERTNELRAEALRGYRQYLAQFIQRNQNRPEMQLEVALAHLKTGEAHAVVSEYEPAIAAYAKAVVGFEELNKRSADDRDVLFGLACAKAQWGDALNDQGQFTKAKPHLTHARELFERLVADPTPIRLTRYSSDASGQFVDSPATRLADVILALTTQVNLEELAQPPLAALARRATKRHCELTRRARQSLLGDKSVLPTLPFVVQHRAVQLSLYLANADSASVPLDELADCRTTLDRLLRQYPNYAELRDDLAMIEYCLAERAFAAGNPTTAQKHVTNVMEQLLYLDTADLGLDPKRLRDKSLVVRAQLAYTLAMVAAQQNDEPGFRKHMAIARECLQKFERVKDPRFDHVLVAVMMYAHNAGQASFERETRPEAEASYVAAIQLIDKMRVPVEDDLLNGVKLILCGGAAGMRAAQGKPCGDLVTKGEELLRKLGPMAPADLLLVGRANLHNARGMEAGLNRRDHAAALREYEAALNLMTEALKQNPDDPVFQFLASTSEFMVALTLATVAEDRLDTRPDGDPEALAMIQRARAIVTAQKPLTAINDPGLQQVIEAMSRPRAAFGPLLDKIEAKARGKK